jgi:hypothetical protein
MAAERIPVRLKRPCPSCGGESLYVVDGRSSSLIHCYNGACHYVELWPRHLPFPNPVPATAPPPREPPGYELADHLKSRLSRRS